MRKTDPLFGYPNYPQCEAIVSAAGPGSPYPATAPGGANFFAPVPPGYFPPRSVFTITYEILDGTDPGTYFGGLSVRHTNGDVDTFTAPYKVVAGGVKVNVTATPNEVRPSWYNTTDITSTLSVTVTDSQGNPANSPQSLKFKISIPLIPAQPAQEDLALRGGHAHSGDRPLGIFKVPSNASPLANFTCSFWTDGNLKGGADDSCEFEGKTDNSGKLSLTYTSPPAGGQVIVEVDPIGQTLASGSSNVARILVRVPGLQPLLDNPALYTKTGGKVRHPGPPNPGEADPLLHQLYGIDVNHSGTLVFDQDIAGITSDFKQGFEENGSLTPGYGGETVWINDMSLPLGGLLDIGPTGTCFLRNGAPCPDWDRPHTYHDLGISCDYNLRNIFPLSGNSNSDEANFLRRIITTRYHLRIHPEGDHWHIYLPGGGP